MKLLDKETNSLDPANSADESAAQVFEVIPLVMRTIRAEMRSHFTSELTVPQYRALGFVRRHPGASLSEVAEHVGLALPSVSKMIDRLEKQGLLTRHSTPGDRRRTSLQMTPLGLSTLQTGAEATRAKLAQKLAALSETDRQIMIQAMDKLRALFSSEGDKHENKDNDESRS